MILSTAEWRKNNPPPPKKVPKTAPVAHSINSNIKKQPQTARATGCHGKCVSDGHNHYGVTEKGGNQIKISEIIYDILDGIPNLYIASNDVQSHISDKNPSIFNNLKTNDLSLSQIKEKVSRTSKASNNDSTFGNKIN
ncbi:hypothetical protein O181_079165 [Austropuccinia psidii MF-1]|uniref:Uncharacterized protein n=1 Tax=Austropuccinia psidii MF-1 TaxID=1389203 RepID=A0A9Q3FKW5_9BASI|nr:hypothetical protein [Austropuccinia psidii MF-1]